MTIGPQVSADVRQRNTALVLRTLRDHGALSRAQLATHSGLTKATVGTIVSALTESGAVRLEGPAPVSAPGRPGRPVTLSGSRLVGLGVEINVHYVTAIAVDLSGEVCLRHHTVIEDASPEGRYEALEDMTRTARDLLAGDDRQISAVTLAVPGLVDRSGRRVVRAPNLGWSDVEVTLADALPQVPLRVENDANCAAQAERARGVARGEDDVVYLTGTVGLGAGIVKDGRLVRGQHGFAGEIGHAPLGDPSRVCGCGRSGCWETSVGLEALARAAELPFDGSDPMDLARRVAERCADDEQADRRLRRVADHLAHGIAVLSATLDPGVIVLGDGFAALGQHFCRDVADHLTERLGRHGPVPPPRIALSSLGLDAAALGAAESALAPLFDLA